MSNPPEGVFQDVEAQTATPSPSASSSQSSTSQTSPEKNKRPKIKRPKIEPIKNGYRDIAHLMAYEDSPFAIFRRFGQLNMLNLLCLQAELMDLQGQLKTACEADDATRGTGSERWKFAYSFLAMRKAYQAQNMVGQAPNLQLNGVSYGNDGQALSTQLPPLQRPAEIRQYGLILDIRAKLKEFNAAVLQVAEIEGLSRPKPHNLECFRTWLMRERERSKDPPKTGLSMYASEGQEYFTWMDMENLEDLIAIQPPPAERDPFQETISYWLISLVELFRSSKDKDGKERLHVYNSARSVAWAPSLLGAILSAMVPVATILGLVHINHILTRIYVLMGITCALALGLKILTSAKTTEVFAITAAFVAVEVVFVGSAPSN